MPRTKKKLKHKVTPIILIAAIQKDRGIGYQGDLLYRSKKDMEHFVSQTKGNTVVMGRKTWESIPEKFIPFSDRTNIVITRDTSYKAKGAKVVHKFYEAIEEAPEGIPVYIIGGGEIYKQALSYAHELDLTVFNGNKKADTFFPEFENYFVEEEASETFVDEKSGISFQFKKYLKK